VIESIVASIGSLSPLLKIALAAWAVLTVAIVVLFFLHRESGSATTRIVLHVTGELNELKLSFGVLHVRDGKDEVRESGPLLNEEIPFKSIDRHGTMEATIRYKKHLGFQFKCFVDHGAHEYAKIERLLTESGFLHVSKGDGAEQRIWFILNEYPTTKTVDGLINNYFYPS